MPNTYSKNDTTTEVPVIGAGAMMIIYNKKGTTTTKYGGALYGFALYTVDTLFGLGMISENEFFFPVAPRSISLSEPTTANVQFTQGGGRFIEHQGNILKTLNVEGTTGFRPMEGTIPFAPDKVPVPTPNYTPMTFMLSPEVLGQGTGMQHFFKLRNLFRKYFDKKADPAWSSKTVMVWFNMKEGEYFVVEPQTFETRRDSSSPFSFSYNIQCQVIDFMESLQLGVFRDAIAWRALANSLNPLQPLNDIIDFGASLVRELKQVTGVLAAVAGSIGPSLVNSIEGFNGSMNSYKTASVNVQGPTVDVMDLSVSKVQEVNAYIDAASEALGDTSTSNPFYGKTNSDIYLQTQNTVHKCYQYTAKLHAFIVDSMVKASKSVPANPYQQPAQSSETNVKGVPGYPALYADSGTTPLSPGFSTKSVTYLWDYVHGDEDIFKAAKRLMGNSAYWKMLVEANKLEPPYIGVSDNPHVLGSGSVIKVPQFGGVPDSDNVVHRPAVDEAGQSAVQTLRDLGTDIAVRYTVHGVETVIDLGTTRSGDLETISGIKNMGQALNLKLMVEQGALPLHPEYGLLRVTGNKGVFSVAQQQAFAFKSTMHTDKRVESVDKVQVTIDGDIISTKGNVKVKEVRVPLSVTLETLT